MPITTRYEFQFTSTSDGNVTMFSVVALPSIDDQVAKGIRAGLRKVPGITNVMARKVVEDANDVGGTDPA